MSVEKLTLELIMVKRGSERHFLSFVDSTFYVEISHPHCHMYSSCGDQCVLGQALVSPDCQLDSA